MNNFTMVDNEILALNLSGQAFKLYFLLKSYCFGNKITCFPSQKTLAERLNKSVRTVQRGLKELTDCGLIKIKRRGSISNVYELAKPLNKVLDDRKENNDKESNHIHHKINSFINENFKTNSRHKKYYNSQNTYSKQSSWKDKKDHFNDYEQRKYDYEKLERLLLGQASPSEYTPEYYTEIIE